MSLKLAPRSIYTSGKGTTGAGLTAAAVKIGRATSELQSQ